MDEHKNEGDFRSKDLTTIQAKRLIGMLISSFNDYTASRVLFMAHCFPEACNYGCTSIEKFFKAFFLFDDINPQREHDITKLFRRLEQSNPTVTENLSLEFLTALYHIYKFRYIGDQMVDYNFAIVGKKFLAELDYTYALLDPHIKFGWKKYSLNNTSLLQQHIKDQNPSICNYNYLALNKSRDEFVTAYDWIYEVRVIENGELVSAHYATDNSENDKKFLYEALILGDNKRSLKHTHRMIHPDELQKNHRMLSAKLAMNGM